MRIAMIGPFGLRPKGTMSVRALPLARELAALGHAVLIVMPAWHTPEEPPRRWEDGGVTLEYVPLGPRLPILSYLLIAARLVRRALAWRPHVVHCFKPKAYSGLAAWLLWHMRRMGLVRTRLVVDEDDWEGPGGWNDVEPYPRRMRAFFAWQERWGLAHADALTVASRALQSIVWSRGVPVGRVHYLPNGAIPRRRGDRARVRDQYALGNAPIVLLYTRFFEFDVARAVETFGRILAQAPEARLLVVGAALFPEADRRFDRLVERAGLGGRVLRAGWVPEEALPDYFAASDVAIYPFDDTLINRCKCSVKLTDLLSVGVAVVADAVGQNAEYITHGETGLLVPAGDIEAMADAAVRLIRDDDLRRSLGSTAARRMADRYAWSRLALTALAAYAGEPSSSYSLRSRGGKPASGSGTRGSI